MWSAVPLSKGQLLDVNTNDILFDGKFRKCNVYKGGGGYDHFPMLSNKYFGQPHNLQFIVQLFGCNLDCPYCYVTREGVWSEGNEFSSGQLVKYFNQTDCTVFHLMGGAPALYMKHWPELIRELKINGKANFLFHSDIMLSEHNYSEDVLREIAFDRALYAVNIKGVTPEEYERNTRKKMNEKMIWQNLSKMEKNDVPYYITFTGVSKENTEMFWDQYKIYFGEELRDKRFADAYTINLIIYNAQPHIDDVPWGKQAKKKMETA